MRAASVFGDRRAIPSPNSTNLVSCSSYPTCLRAIEHTSRYARVAMQLMSIPDSQGSSL